MIEDALGEALRLASLGLAVFPVHGVRPGGACTCGRDCGDVGKHPRLAGGFRAAVRDDAGIRSVFGRPSNIGVATGAVSGVWVLDVDDHGADGRMSLAALAAEHGPLPDTVESTTGGGGRHLWFRMPEGGGKVPCSQGRVGPGLDVRGDGGYVVAPPSVHRSGRVYAWDAAADPFDPDFPMMFADAPGWLLDLARGRTVTGAKGETSSGSSSGTPTLGRGAMEPPCGVAEGGRNDALFRYAASLRGYGADEGGILAALEGANATFRPPLPPEDLRRIAGSAAKLDANRIPGARPSPPPMAPPPRRSRVEVGEEPEPEPEFDLNELGTAERFVHRYGRDLRYCHLWGRWLVWDGLRWRQDETGGAPVVQRAMDLVRSMLASAWTIKDDAKRAALAGWAAKCHSRAKIENVVALARSMPGVPVTPLELDLHPDLINVANGTYDLAAGALREPRREDLLTRRIPHAYDPDADCPRWVEFLQEILPDTDLLRYVWRMCGYVLHGSTQEQCFFFLYGSGANGKSTFGETLMHVMGEDYSRTTTSDVVMLRPQGAGIPNDVARLVGARLVACPETGEGRRLDEERIKQMTGKEQISARFLHQEFFDFKPQFTLLVSGNHKPTIKGTDTGIWRRTKLVPFTVTVPPERMDKRLLEKLTEESEGILAWMIEGHRTWRTEGLGDAEAVAGAVAEYRSESDVLGAFLEDRASLLTGYEVRSSTLYQAYKRWAKSSGESEMSLVKFGRAIEERGFKKRKTESGVVYEGIVLQAEPGGEEGRDD